MSLVRLDISQFRNLASIQLNLLPSGINFFYGKNGSGKTSLIEAVHYLMSGRSFRTTNINCLIQHQEKQFNLFGKAELLAETLLPIGVERWRNGESRIKIAGKSTPSLAQLARQLPTLLLHAGSHQLIEAGPLFRRKYLDWGAFYLSHDYLQNWKLYMRALKQRNALLRKKSYNKELVGWTEAVIHYGLKVHQVREAFVTRLLPCLTLFVNRLLTCSDLTLSYFPGWSEDQLFADAIKNSLANDMNLGWSQIGPHRADFNIKMNKIPLKDILSRGQQKLFVCAMLLAQGMLIKQHGEGVPVYLVDDLPSELDKKSRDQLIALFLEEKTQIFLTAIDSAVIDDVRMHDAVKMFHVEHGEIIAVPTIPGS